MAILGKLRWINREKLVEFILEAQDLESGGIGDRPGDWVDVFHTNFGLCGESSHSFLSDKQLRAAGFDRASPPPHAFPGAYPPTFRARSQASPYSATQAYNASIQSIACQRISSSGWD